MRPVRSETGDVLNLCLTVIVLSVQTIPRGNTSSAAEASEATTNGKQLLQYHRCSECNLLQEAPVSSDGFLVWLGAIWAEMVSKKNNLSCSIVSVSLTALLGVGYSEPERDHQGACACCRAYLVQAAAGEQLQIDVARW